VPASTVHSPQQLTEIAAALGVAVGDFSKPSSPHLLYESANGDRWLLFATRGHAFVRHVRNASSGGIRQKSLCQSF
jgi:hypothetical protein